MTPGERRETPQQRRGQGTAQALQRAFPPDQAADDVLGRLIGQIDALPWPRSPAPTVNQ